MDIRIGVSNSVRDTKEGKGKGLGARGEWHNAHLDGDQCTARVADPHLSQLPFTYQRDDVWEMLLHPSREQDRAGDPCEVCRWCEQGTCKRFILLNPACWH